MVADFLHAPGRIGSVYPFSALAGQEEMKLALLLLAVDPNLGGVLLVGQKGTAKSTAVRALAELLPEIGMVPDCRFHCDPKKPANYCSECHKRFKDRAAGVVEVGPTPFLTLPLGATEDRVAGGLDLELSVRTGKPHLRIGLLGQANRGFVYVDEVNLLEPYLAHLLLDAAESGRMYVEREGISLWHPAQVALIGTMNPEEGPLGPQFADRFALTARIQAEADPVIRAEIVRRRLAFEADPVGFRAKWAGQTDKLVKRLAESRQRLPRVFLKPEAKDLISLLVRAHQVRGHRGDLALARAAKALAAWQGSAVADDNHVWSVSELALESRKTGQKTRQIQEEDIKVVTAPPPRQIERPYIPPEEPEREVVVAEGHGDGGQLVQKLFQASEVFEVVTPVSRRDQGPKGRTGRRTARQTTGHRGRYYRSSPQRLGRPVALDATLRAAAPYQKSRRIDQSSHLIVRGHDFREKVFRQKTGRLIVFVVDASGSVGSLNRMSEAKAAALSLLSEAYQKRDRVGLIGFHGTRAEILLPPTDSVEMANRLLRELPTGGKTPMAAALLCTHQLVRLEMARDPGLTPLIVIMTDGRPNVPLTEGVDPWREVLGLAGQLARDARLRFLLVDTDRGHYNDYKLTRDLAEKLGAPRLTLEDLRLGRLEAWLEQVA